ncbi:hypothetical protein VaNZ11_013238 [Volvox africanus]|uniref:ABC1 atypical kinase-like domain-containing protein n=1 Tax=Volvox africanus TaxID=51714 RepID=A0ABQ5SFR4_9CHLO|nr:hypothetical protein VaNZ11_013238 [Volvox africanus]
MSWITPKNLEDASRILQGLALVAARMASDSKLARRAAASDYIKALQYASDLLQYSAEDVQQAAANAARQAADTSVSASVSESAPGTAPASPASCIFPLTDHKASTASTTAGVAADSLADAAASALLQGNPAVPTRSSSCSTLDRDHDASSSTGDSSTQYGYPTADTAAALAPLLSPISPAPTFATQGLPSNVLKQEVTGIDETPTTAMPIPTSTPTSISNSSSTSSTSSRVAASKTEAAAPPLPPKGDAVQPCARLPSVHDDVVVAAIATASEEQLLGPGEGKSRVSAGTAGRGAAAATEPQSPPPADTGPTANPIPSENPQPAPARKLRERRVPETPLGRALGFAGLGASLLVGSLADNFGKAFRGPGKEGTGAPSGAGGGSSSLLTEANAERLANALCRMRGAALKIGQMLSIQDESVLPPQVQAALERVRAGADVMPRSQLERVLVSELGPDWHKQLREFDWEPRAAASIGQVHTAVLLDGRRVAMKIQYPGVARSIESDVDNLMRLISVANVLPRGMFVEKAARVAKQELALECDYTYELSCQQRYRALIAADPELSAHFHVPDVVPSLSSQRILTSEWVRGVPIDKVCELPQTVRDTVGSRLLQLTLKELFEWRFMQTDPNWGNFLYDMETDRLNLIDFGASKDYPESFVMDYLRMVGACAERDRQGVIEMSIKLGFLTGDESEVMMEAHSQAGFVVGVPFAAAGLYDFGSHGGMTARVSELGSVMLKHRLTPPPQESYSLHRKLSGAFLACMKLKARVPCREMFCRTYQDKLGHFLSPRLDGTNAAAADVGSSSSSNSNISSDSRRGGVLEAAASSA